MPILAFLEKIKLLLRARKYKNRNDKGGIQYILTKVQANQTCMDIGVHKAGYLYYMLKKVGAQGKCYGFEPQTTLFQGLVRLKSLLKWENVTLENIALSNQKGTQSFYIPLHRQDATSPGATLLPHPDRPDWKATTVQTTTLDEYCLLHKIQPNFLKIDVEGNELEVLEGGKATLLAHFPAILVEIEARHVGETKARKTFEFLEQLGYKGYFIENTTYRPLTEWSFETFQTVGKEPYCNNFIFEK